MSFMSQHFPQICFLSYISLYIAISSSPLRRTPSTSSGTTGLPSKRRLVPLMQPILLDTIPVEEFASLSSATTLPLDWDLWHRRLCHHHLAGIKKLLSGNLVMGFKLDSQASPDLVCEACKAGKMHADPFPISTSRTSKLLQLVHSDVHGPVKVPTHQGYRYWVTFIDDFSRFKAVYLLKRKSETFTAFKQFKAWSENLTGAKLGTLRDDKGGEYMSGEFEAFCLEHGIQRQHTVRN